MRYRTSVKIQVLLAGFVVSALLLTTAFNGSGSKPPVPEEPFPWPSVELRNGTTKALVALPGPSQAFYQGPRFDHSGFIYKLQTGNLSLFGPWKLDFKQGALDGVTGMAGEFGMTSPLGFEDAKPGAHFMKIGVGHLIKPDAGAYTFARSYEVANPGTWTVKTGEDYVESIHQLPPLRGWQYQYRKRIELATPDSILIRYHLKNTGSKPIKTDYYAHNLFVFNQLMIQTGDKATILADQIAPRVYKPATVAPRVIEFKGPIQANKGYSLEIPLAIQSEKSVVAHIFNEKSRASVTVAVDYKPSKLVFYAHDKAMSIEPFIAIELKPGEALEWSDLYTISGSGRK